MTEWDLSALGVLIHVTVEDPQLAAEVRELTAPLLAAEADRPGVHATVTVEGARPWRVASPAYRDEAPTPQRAVSAVLGAVNLTAVDRTPHLAMHAAVVEVDGHVLALPAASGTGKTTLTTALLQRGCRYVTDESLTLRWEDASLVAYPRALALSDWTRNALGLPVDGAVPGDGETVYLPHLLAARPWHPDPSVRVSHVLVPVRERRGPAVEPLHRAEALGELLRRGFTVHRDPGRALTLLADLVSSATTWTVALGDPHDTADLVLRHVREGHGNPS